MDNSRVKQVTTEDLRDWFGKGKEGGAGGGGWDRYNTKGERIGKCGDAEDRGGDGEGKPKCLSKEKAAQLRAKGGKEAIANAVKRKKAQDSVTDRQGTGNAPRPVSNRIGEEVLSEKNVPTNPGLWSRAKSAAKSKFDVYPSAYANGWASKWYKSKGGGWKSEETEQPLDNQSVTSADLEWGSDSATRIYKAMTPGQENEAWEKNPNCQQCGKKLSPQDLKKGNRICATCHKQNKGKVWGKDSDDDYTESVNESEYEGRAVTLNKPFRTSGGPKKFSVYVNNEKGNVVKVNFGDPDMEIKRDDPDRRANYRARHNCDNPGPKWKANYWSCKNWSSTPVSKITEEPVMKIPTFKEYLHENHLYSTPTGPLATNVPPPEMESFMKKNKSAYVKQHGEEVGMSMLTAAAWDKHNREKAERDSSMTEEAGDDARMALAQLKSIIDRAMAVHNAIEKTGIMDLPAWVQSQITEADSSVLCVYDYVMYSPSEE